MQNRIMEFDVELKQNIDKSFRIEKIKNDYDLQIDNIAEHFSGTIELPNDWQIGVIVGNSGTGKSTIAKELFKDSYIKKFDYNSKSVVDNMPKECSTDQISNMFFSVGFASVPSWCKPYHVLSNGEKMRVDLARALLSHDFIVFDEFTSVVDRRVAETMCIATNKSVKRTNKKFVAVTCHYDILEWLQSDWYFDTNKMHTFFQQSHAQEEPFVLKDVQLMRGKYSKSIII